MMSWLVGGSKMKASGTKVTRAHRPRRNELATFANSDEAGTPQGDPPPGPMDPQLRPRQARGPGLNDSKGVLYR